jgi:hypothetical protein
MFIFTLNIQANSSYHSFESLELTEGKLLSDYTKDDYSTYYKKVSKRMFAGWRVHKVNEDIKVSYVTETMFSYYNDGYTPIDYTFKMDRKQTTKVSLSSSGSIGLKSDTSGKGFKHNLDASLKLTSEYTQTTEEKESYEISFEVDPGTQVDLFVYGEGKITNGVAARYLFWIRLDRGGFEIFMITTQYQRLEKKKI